ncbi:MAG: aminotransferase class III-fold pyridoxal phosphate-dependent enzyme [Cyclobacteriaceae bacterium]|nr:aminotransferase class III-fold pyridoxal phosphate-dependent enzyme [Cyclobacteriaceae bacterium]
MKLFDVYSLQNINLVKGEGSWVWDDQGTRYLDLYGGHAVISIGHNHRLFVQALKEQLEKISFYSNSVLNPLQDQLAERLGRLSGYPDYNLFLVNSGAEANENALKIASFVTGRKKVVAFRKAFHGRTSGAVAITDNPKIVAPFNAGHEVEFLPFNDIDTLRQRMDSSVAAVIIEGIQGVAGIQVPEPAFLQAIEAECNRTGALLILDEIQSGYGRTGQFFAHQHAGIRPHLITMAKGMGNGFPIGGVLIHPDIKATGGMLGTTFGGNHLACAAALAVLQAIENQNLLLNASTVGSYLIEKLSGHGFLGPIRGRGLMIGFDVPEFKSNLRAELLNKYKIFTGEAKPNVIRLLPSLALSRQEADVFLEALSVELQALAVA